MAQGVLDCLSERQREHFSKAGGAQKPQDLNISEDMGTLLSLLSLMPLALWIKRTFVVVNLTCAF